MLMRPVRRLQLDRGDGAAMVVLALACAVLATLRWSGAEPFGSDNDEYIMVSRAIWQDGQALVAGVEGTKYPLGYPAFIGALEVVGLPLVRAALVLNGLLVAVAAGATYLTARRSGRSAALTAALVLLASSVLWASYYTVMPDVALVALTAVVFAWLAVSPAGRADVVVLTAAAVAAVLLKSLALTLALAWGVALLVRGRARACWAPPAAALAVIGLQSLFMSRYPEPVTGYGLTFWQVDPGDASAGRIGLTGLPARAWEQSAQVLAEPAQALAGGLGVLTAGALGVLLVGLAALRLPAWRWPLLALFASHLVLLSVWNFRGTRFALYLVPLLAVGAGALVGLLRPAAVRAAGAAGAALLLLLSVPALRADAAVDEERYRSFNAAATELREWVDRELTGDDLLVSLDYREVSYRLDRRVLPIAYDRDPAALRAATAGEGADYLVTLRGLYGRREGIADVLVGAYPQEFTLVWSTDRIDVYAVGPSRSE